MAISEKVRGPGSVVVASAQAAVDEVKARTSGHRRAFTVTVMGKVVHCVAHNPHCAAHTALVHLGGVVDELKVVTVDEARALLASIPKDTLAAALKS